ncbi:hypothetical protein [Prosthecobacter sp.]
MRIIITLRKFHRRWQRSSHQKAGQTKHSGSHKQVQAGRSTESQPFEVLAQPFIPAILCRMKSISFCPLVKFSVCLLLLTVSSGCTRETWRRAVRISFHVTDEQPNLGLAPPVSLHRCEGVYPEPEMRMLMQA